VSDVNKARTAAEHYAAAERLLSNIDRASESGGRPLPAEWITAVATQAVAHATLALAPEGIRRAAQAERDGAR
jgi:hypothetical protein